MADFFYIIHYVIYRFYRRHKENYSISLISACGILLFLSFVIIGSIDYFLCILLETPLHIDKPFAWGYIIFWSILEYIVFYRNERYREIFDEYDRLSNTPEMETKIRNAKIFNFCLLAINILLLIIADYINHHK